MNALTGKIIVGIAAAIVIYLFGSRNRNRNYVNEQRGHQEDEPRPAKCSVCLNDFSNFSKRLNLPCGHPLHPACAELLLVQRENSCPWCRKEISPEFLRAHFPE